MRLAVTAKISPVFAGCGMLGLSRGPSGSLVRPYTCFVVNEVSGPMISRLKALLLSSLLQASDSPSARPDIFNIRPMKPWIVAGVLGVVLAKCTTYIMPLLAPDGDPWAIYPTAAAVCMWSLLPPLVVGCLLVRWVRPAASVGLAVVGTLALLVTFAHRASGLWLWQLSWLGVVPCVLCGLPLVCLAFMVLRKPNSPVP
jgi:hypothetical protein